MSSKKKNNFKRIKLYIVLSFIGLLCINNINKTNGASILKLVKYNNKESNEESTNKHNYNQNNINNHININININKVNDTKNNKKIENDINNKTTEIINEKYIENNNMERIETKEILDKNYTVIGSIVKQSIIYDKNINNFLGEVIIHYNNIYHNHHYCKINIVISKKINVMYIRKYIYNFYNFNRQINLICNYYDCLELFNYKTDINQDEFYKCNILNTIQLKDEL